MKNQESTSSLTIVVPFLALLLHSPSTLLAQPAVDKTLMQSIERICSGFNGIVGVYVRNLKTGRSAAFNADSLFPTASMIKVPILCAVFDRIERGELSFREPRVYRDSLKYDDGITGSLRDSTRISINMLTHLMISVSDNTAALWLQVLAGTGTAINNWLEQNGFHHTRMNSRTPGREPIWEIYGWGMTTPREMAELLASIRSGKVVSPAASEKMYRILCRSALDDGALSQIPPSAQVASKQGAVDESRSEVVLVNGPSGDYVFCVITKNQKDKSWGKDNEGYVLIRNISRLLWNSFEPGHSWSPATGTEKF